MTQPHQPQPPLPLARRLRRRELLQRAAQMGIALPALGAISAACGGSSGSGSSAGSTSSAPPTGTAVLLNYDGWMGKNTVAEFQAAFPGANLKQTTGEPVSPSAKTIVHMAAPPRFSTP